MSFVVVIGIMALVFSKIEGWYFFGESSVERLFPFLDLPADPSLLRTDGVYFSIVSTLTVGFGDFAPTKVSTKVSRSTSTRLNEQRAERS